jgi:hypothetical protein
LDILVVGFYLGITSNGKTWIGINSMEGDVVFYFIVRFSIVK